MPRKSYKIDLFHGGWNSEADPRDIADYELSTAQNVMVGHLGRITMMGGDAVGTYNIETISMRRYRNGYGLFAFSSDYNIACTAAPTQMYAIVGKDATSHIQVAIWSSTGGRWATETEIKNSSTMVGKPAFYYADGGLRVCAGDLDDPLITSSTNCWIGYIKRTHFSGLAPGGSADEYAGWYSKDNTLAAPARGLYGLSTNLGGTCDADSTSTVLSVTLAGAFTGFNTEIAAANAATEYYWAINTTQGVSVAITAYTSATQLVCTVLPSGDWIGDTFRIYPYEGLGFNVDVLISGSITLVSGFPVGTYEFGSTFIYDGTQESKIFNLIGNGVAITTNAFYPRILAKSPFNPRISGGNIYTRIQGSDDDWIRIAEIDMELGCRMPGLEWNAWAYEDSDGDSSYVVTGPSNTMIDELPTETYKSLNGDIDQSRDIIAKFKTAVVINRAAYIGNVLINSKRFADSIFKSYVNRFDTFTEDRRLDVAINDGEEIVKLEAFADRILEFKNKTLYIINVSQDLEYVESKHEFMGISYPYQSCVTEFGVAWINDMGCFLYTGERIVDLLLDISKPEIRKIALSTWQTHLNTYSYVMYSAKDKLLIVGSTYGGEFADEIMIYEFTTGSWTYGLNKITQDGVIYWRTNHIVNSNGECEWIYSTTDTGGSTTTCMFRKWDNTPMSSRYVQIYFKDIDFGDISKRKTIYCAYVTYKNSGFAASGVRMGFSVNGDAAFTNKYTFTMSTSFVTKEISLVTSTLRNIYTLRLGVYSISFTSASFVLNDITIIYRDKTPR